jgi:hypothetical protein
MMYELDSNIVPQWKIALALKQNRLYRIADSFIFAVQIPDGNVGCSGSRCTNCNSKTAYCIHLCTQCGFPFVGPYGFPQISEWDQMNVLEKSELIEKIYSSENHGRITYTNVEHVPLTPNEAKRVTHYSPDDTNSFTHTHGKDPSAFVKRSIQISS